MTYRNWRTGGLASDPNANGRFAAGGTSGPRAFVNALFTFSGKLGEDYSGIWQDDSTFVVTVTSVSTTYGIVIGSTTVQALNCPEFIAYICGDITNMATTSPSSVDTGVLQGTFGARTAPRLLRFEAVDPDEGDLHYSAGGELDLPHPACFAADPVTPARPDNDHVAAGVPTFGPCLAVDPRS